MNMMKHAKNICLDLVPALSGLIGKIALASSFALVWAQELGVSTPNFVFENVRIEILVGCVITLVAGLMFRHIAPAGTLAPLIVIIPTMATFGAHPLILSILVGILGIISVKTKLLTRILLFSGDLSKASLSLVFGVSGVIMAAEKLISFFGDKYIALILLAAILALTYVFLLKRNKSWLIIPFSAIASLLVPLIFGMKIEVSSTVTPLNFSPDYWWNDMWGIGYGFDVITILKTLPFALFVVLLWAMDTVTINTLIDTARNDNETKEDINVERSFIVVSVRNMLGGLFGGAQTGSLWRSFLIPLYMMKRPLRPATILLSSIGIAAGVFSVPIEILSYPPLIWTALLFGIFIPFLTLGIKGLIHTEKASHKTILLILSACGIIVSPIATWVGAVLVEKITRKFLSQQAQ